MSKYLGFQFPKEHGLVSFWVATLVLAVYSSYLFSFQLVNLVLGLVFSYTVIMSYLSMKRMVKGKMKKIVWPQVILIAFLSMTMLLYSFSKYLLLVFAILGLFTLIWAILAYSTVRHDYNELGFGILTLTIHFPLILFFSANLNSDSVKEILIIWWLFGGIANATTIRVGSLRNKIGHSVPFVRTVIFTATFLPLHFLANMHWIFLLAFIDPFVQNYLQMRNKTIVQSGSSSIRRLGWSLVISLMITTIIIIIGMYLQFN